MRTRLSRVLVWGATALLAAAVLLFWAAGRDASVRWMSERAVAASGGRLSIEGSMGSLLGEARAQRVEWRDAGTVVAIHGLHVGWHPVTLLDGRLLVERIDAARIEIDLPVAAAGGGGERHRLPARIALPVPVGVNRVGVKTLVVRRAGEELARIEGLEAMLAAGEDRLTIGGLRGEAVAAGRRIAFKGDASSIPSQRWPTEVRLQASTDVEGRPVKLELRVDGPFDALDARARTRWADAVLNVRTTVHPLDARPLRTVDLSFADVDLARVRPGLPRTLLGGRLVAEMFPAWTGEGTPPVFAGPLTLTNELAGSLDAARIPVSKASSVISLAGRRVDLRTIRIAGPAGEASGRGWWSPEGFGVEASSEAVQLQGIDAGLQPRSVKARVTLAPLPRPAAPGLALDVQVADADGDLNLRGQLADDWLSIAQADLRLKGAGAAAGVARVGGKVQVRPPFAIDLEGRVDALEPHRLVKMPPGRFSGRFAIDGRLGSASPATATATAPGVSADARSGAAKGAPQAGLVRATVQLADSAWQSLPLAGDATFRVALRDARPVRFFDVAASLRWGSASLSLHGGLGDAASALGFEFAAERLAQWKAGVDGRLAGRGSLRGDLHAPTLDATLDATRLTHEAGGIRTVVDAAAVVARGVRVDGQPMTIEATSSGVRVVDTAKPPKAPPLLALASLRATLGGTSADHRIVVEGDGTGQRLRLSARGGAGAAGGDATAWRGRVLDLSITHPLLRMPPAKAQAPGGAHLSSTQAFGLVLGADRVDVDAARFDMQGARIDVQRLYWRDGRLDLAGAAAGLPSRWLARVATLDALYGDAAADAAARRTARDAAGTASARVAAPPDAQRLSVGAAFAFRGTLSDPGAEDWQARLTVAREDGDLFLRTAATPQGRVSAGLTTLRLDARLEARRARVLLDIDGERIGRISGDVAATLPAQRARPFWDSAVRAQSPLGGTLEFSMRSFRWVSPLIGEAWQVDGALAANLDVKGTLAAPRLEGIVTGTNLSAEEQALGMRFTDGVLAAEFAGDRVDVKVLRLSSGDGSVSMTGLLRTPAAGGSMARVEIASLPIPLGVGQRVVLSGDATAALADGDLRIGGRLVADEGVIELRGNTAPGLSDDVVIARPARDGAPQADVGEAASAPAPAGKRPFRVLSDVEIDMGQRFRVFGSGVEAKLRGAIRLRGSLPDAPRANGTVEIRDGTYQIYGRKLEITRGRVVFNGPLDDPNLDILAIRRHLQVEPGVEISGTASSPNVKLVSTPDVADAEKLSWLVLGTGLADAQGSGQLLVLQAAADTLFGDEDSKYADSLTERVGIDMLSVREDGASSVAPGTQTGQGTVVTVGKRLSNRLFVTYEQSLRGVWNILKLQYDISDRLSLSVQAGSDSAADLLWFFPFD
ncbi:MAG: translocation/assembly module TamB domain-containing protein [Lautropia sp.]